MLTQEWSEFIESGVAILLGCVNKNGIPDGARVVGAVVSFDRTKITVYIEKESATRIMHKILEMKEVAMTIAQPSTYKTIQVKGTYLSHRDTDERDRIILARYKELFLAETKIAGVPNDTMKRLRNFPAIAFDIFVKEVFSQTPGPKAGEKLT